jgi:hypothetical protein
MSQQSATDPSQRTDGRPSAGRSSSNARHTANSRMQLSGEMFTKVISQLKGVDNKSGLRSEPRVGVRSEVSITLLDETAAARAGSRVAKVRDLSPSGIGLLAEISLEAGCLFAIRLPVQGGTPVVAVYKVMHSVMVEEEMYSIGARLMKLQESVADAPPKRPAKAVKPKPAAAAPAPADSAAAAAPAAPESPQTPPPAAHAA